MHGQLGAKVLVRARRLDRVDVAHQVGHCHVRRRHVLQLVQQLEATFARLFFVAIAGDDTLREMLDAASSSPVLWWDGDAASLALQASKLLALDDTVLYGRTLLMQANSRSAVLHADAALQQQTGG